MKKTFYSNGKLLITGEYLVLDGAKALALPTKFGQNLTVEAGENQNISWKSFDYDNSVWFENTISFESIIKKEQFDENQNVKNTLIEILHEAYLLNPNYIVDYDGYTIETQLTFPKIWGLGTSSTLINNIAQWLKIDAFELLKNSFGGSGYDIACAQNDSAIIYQLENEKPLIEKVHFKPIFSDKIHFVYLNKKQNSKTQINSYLNKRGDITSVIPIIDGITHKVTTAVEPKIFALELQKHEIELSNLLEMQTIKESLFPDFDGIIKSLGAWGGDFVLVISKQDPNPYFKERGYNVVVPYHEMIL
jgi:mevalonate kinase